MAYTFDSEPAAMNPLARAAKWIVSGHLWHLKCLAISVLCTVLFTCSPAILHKEDADLPPAYAMKAEHPFADTSRLTEPTNVDERAHGAQLTPRLTGSILLWTAIKMRLHPYLPATIFGLVYLFGVIKIAADITSDRTVGFLSGLLFAGLYGVCASFSINCMPKPFDGIALGMVALSAMSMRRPLLLFISVFLGCWSDERCLISFLLLFMTIQSWPSLTPATKGMFRVTVGAAFAAYLATRILLSRFLGWNSPDPARMDIALTRFGPFAQLALWQLFEGAWGMILLVVWRLFMSRKLFHAATFVLGLAIAVISVFVVKDASRSGVFAFPIVFAALAELSTGEIGSGEMRRIMTFSAIVTLLAPNYVVITGFDAKWIPSFPVRLLLP